VIDHMVPLACGGADAAENMKPPGVLGAKFERTTSDGFMRYLDGGR
jgi:hypothetical protein